ncbi:hypothetical protein METBIDRAFT_98232 [Metschnikowia bicuspidata var. bicuspidata NRRL YB-4993]|uniref:Uncharacterized protein n=1 Tax=Metschnikowia bicuspidata var. bicuspidata NRRL YB-4993 TaxID=869754 RepID=A0A1A0HGE4_9ASCO|nr:hypothetical protein METBIDRAFT_98232 [Metschnikowia bicuspidata var. bicuspidata NRRL YB-4993]OBA23076.1 hypothetical protein METBIDRAFT_98232 [Metschnikowia bicuspidata var. bicuspidata NRRL YB-4993]
MLSSVPTVFTVMSPFCTLSWTCFSFMSTVLLLLGLLPVPLTDKTTPLLSSSMVGTSIVSRLKSLQSAFNHNTSFHAIGVPLV